MTASATQKRSQISLYDLEKPWLEKANDALKKMEITMFRNTMSNKKLKEFKITQSTNIFGKNGLHMTSKKHSESMMKSSPERNQNQGLSSFIKLNSPSQHSLAYPKLG